MTRVAVVHENVRLVYETGHLFGVDGLFITWGQSNDVGQGDYNHVGDLVPTSVWNFGAPYASVYMREQTAVGPFSPIPWAYVNGGATTLLQPYAPAGNVNMGPELSFGRFLYEYGGYTKPYVGKSAISGSGLDIHWNNPAYPTGGPSLLDQFLTFVGQCQEVCGIPVTAFVMEQGWSDAQSSGAASRWKANLQSIMAAVRARFGTVPIVIGKVNINHASAPFKSTVIAQQQSYVADDPNSVLVSNDDLSFGAGDPHYSGFELFTMGRRFAKAIIDIKKPGHNYDQAATTAPWVQGMDVGEQALFPVLGQTTIRPRWPTEHKSGDRAMMICVVGAQDIDATLTDAQGFVELSVSPIKSSAFGTHVRLHAYWCLATSSSMAAPTITTNNDSGAARIFVFRNCISSGDPFDVISTWANNTIGKTIAIPGGTTFLTNELVAVFMTGFGNGGYPNFTNSWVNGDLTGVTLVQGSDYAPATAHMLIHLVTGTKAAIGAFGTTTGTLHNLNNDLGGFGGVMCGLAISLPNAASTGGSGATTISVTLTDSVDPVITGGDAFSYAFNLTNTGSNQMTGLSVAITVDSSLTIGTPSGIGWTCNTAGHVITCTRVHGWIGAQPTITIPVTTGSSALTASTSVAVTGSNFSTANATQTTVVGLVASDNGRYFPQSTAQWNTLIARRGLVNWVAPDMLHLMQEASGNLADSTGSFTLTASGTGLAYQQTVSGFTTKAVTTTDAGTGAFSTTSASLPDLSATSFLYLAYLMETATPATSRSLVTMGTTRVAAEVGNNNFVTCIGGVNSAGGVGNIQNTLQPQIVLHDKTNSRQGEYNNTDSAEPTFGSTATGKKLAVGAAARSSATCSYMFGAGWTGAHAERSRQDIHDMQIALGFPASWTP